MRGRSWTGRRIFHFPFVICHLSFFNPMDFLVLIDVTTGWLSWSRIKK
jgi:hypothetical protein